MKICYIVPWFPSHNINTHESQQGIFEYRNVTKLSERGYKFKIISMKWKGQLEYEKISENIEIFRVPYFFNLVRYPLPHFRKLSRKIVDLDNALDSDVIVYSHTIFLTALPSLYLKNKIKKPVIAVTDCIPGVNWFYGNKIVDSIGYIHSKTLGKKILDTVDGIRLLSSHNYEDILKLGINPKKISVITRGVNDETFKPREPNKFLKEQLNVKENEKIILFVGRMDIVKGVDYLISAAKKIVSEHEDVKFLIVGDGSSRTKYEEQTKEFDRIQFLGFRTNIPELMNIADMFVLTSLSEGACNVVMEASASGLPVVATKVGEVPQIIKDGETGILIEPKNVDNLINSLVRLIENPDLSKQMGISARQHIKNNYAEKIIYDKIENFYLQVVKEWNNKNSIILLDNENQDKIKQSSK